MNSSKVLLFTFGAVIADIRICAWYSDLSSNEAFIQQLRLAITSAATNITNRLYKTDISDVIFNRLIPIGIRHA